MNILYLTISYNLKSKGLYQALVDELVNNGHTVTIVRSMQNDLGGAIEIVDDRLKCLNVKTADPFKSNLIKKGINQSLLNFYFKRAIKNNLLCEKYDLILYATPPITLVNTIKYCKKYYSAKTFLMLKDIFPQNAVDLKLMKENGLIHKYFRMLEKKYYECSDYIGCMSQRNIDYVKSHNNEIDENKLHLFYNSIKIDEEEKQFFNNDITRFMFGGNLGKPQNIELLLRIAKKLENYEKAKFIIMGEGTEVKRIKNFINENKLNNLEFRESLAQEEYEKILKVSDVGLIVLDPRFTIPNIPSRFQTYLKLHKPVLAMTDRNTDLKEMIYLGACGWWCDSSNEDLILKCIKEICENKQEQIVRGENGYRYLCKEFDVKINVRQIEEFAAGI